MGIKVVARCLEANEGGREEEEKGFEIAAPSTGRSCDSNWPHRNIDRELAADSYVACSAIDAGHPDISLQFCG